MKGQACARIIEYVLKFHEKSINIHDIAEDVKGCLIKRPFAEVYGRLYSVFQVGRFTVVPIVREQKK